MNPESKGLKTIDEYIDLWPARQQKILNRIRQCIRRVAPEAEECISYQIPAFKQVGVLLYFAMFTHHYSLFPGAEPMEYFASELKDYETSKGTIKIPLEEAVPEQLIERLVLHNLQKNEYKIKAKVKSSKK